MPMGRGINDSVCKCYRLPMGRGINDSVCKSLCQYDGGIFWR
ncbi:hypothetical protein GCWU000282_00813 [Catonella morbi ATCC 51271]|uniref:Uncharacterized protein n=1 Tax=Catonella morbi ATCC 51271 TaxID=592026 RepID=V2Y3Y6_9FIRM|nr:hypothetical protein GCWU000282_00813 [Catonella morbi ATCC 51271]